MAASKGPARDYGILFNDLLNPANCRPGPSNSITDVAGVCVGHANYMLGNYYINGVVQNVQSPPGKGVNTGVTAILPLGNHPQPQNRGPRRSAAPDYSGSGYGIDTIVPAGWFALNGCGEMTGTTWIEESGTLEGPIMLTNTVSVGIVRDAVIDYWKSQQKAPDPFNALLLPVVAETFDGWLNDILAPQFNSDLVRAAIDAAGPSPPVQGNTGSGTGMTCYSWKGGIGTSSRIVPIASSEKRQTYKVGVLVQANQGTWNELVLLGAPVGPVERLKPASSPDDPIQDCAASSRRRRKSSIIVVIATDAPILPHQLKRLARRAALGIARTGTSSHDDSGELCIAFSTANQTGFNTYAQTGTILSTMEMLPNDVISPCLFTATVEATEEAIINALIAAQDLTTTNGNKGCAITNSPQFQSLVQKWRRWKSPNSQ